MDDRRLLVPRPPVRWPVVLGELQELHPAELLPVRHTVHFAALHDHHVTERGGCTVRTRPRRAPPRPAFPRTRPQRVTKTGDIQQHLLRKKLRSLYSRDGARRRETGAPGHEGSEHSSKNREMPFQEGPAGRSPQGESRRPPAGLPSRAAPFGKAAPRHSGGPGKPAESSSGALESGPREGGAGPRPQGASPQGSSCPGLPHGTHLLTMPVLRVETTVGPDLRGRRPFRSFRKENSLLCRWRSWSSCSQRSWSKAVRHRGARTMCSLISKGANLPQEPARVWNGEERDGTPASRAGRPRDVAAAFRFVRVGASEETHKQLYDAIYPGFRKRQS